MGIDQIYYQYKSNMFDEQCYEETNVGLHDKYVPNLEIQCNVMSPYAHMTICIVDDELLSPNEDTATIPKCCHADNNGNNGGGGMFDAKPTVCYTLQISCESKCVDENMARKNKNRKLLRGNK